MYKILIKVLVIIVILISNYTLVSACDAGDDGCESSGSCSGENCLTSTDFVFKLTGLIGGSVPENESSVESVNVMITRVVELALIAIVFISASLIVIGGLWMVSSGGNSERISRGKTIIMYNVIAIVVALMAYIIVSVIRWLIFNI